MPICATMPLDLTASPQRRRLHVHRQRLLAIGAFDLGRRLEVDRVVVVGGDHHRVDVVEQQDVAVGSELPSGAVVPLWQRRALAADPRGSLTAVNSTFCSLSCLCTGMCGAAAAAATDQPVDIRSLAPTILP